MDEHESKNLPVSKMYEKKRFYEKFPPKINETF